MPLTIPKIAQIRALLPVLAPAAILAASLLALAGAFTAQYGFNLRPCDLCLIQRFPFALNALIAIAALILPTLAYKRAAIGAAGIAFLINSGIALYHSGVERKWWEGLSGCSTPDMSGSVEDLIKRIQETDVVRCDEIPWEFLGLSMANYNVVYCVGLGILCLGAAWMIQISNPSASEISAKHPT